MKLSLAPNLTPELLRDVPLGEIGFELSDAPGVKDEPWLVILDPERSGRDDAQYIAGLRREKRFIEFIIVARNRDFDMLRKFLRLGVIDCLLLPCPPQEWRRSLEDARDILSSRWLTWNAVRISDVYREHMAELLGSSRTQWDEGALIDKVQTLYDGSGTSFFVLCLWLKFSSSGMDFSQMSGTGDALEKLVQRFFRLRGLTAVTMNQHGMLIVALRCPHARDVTADAQELLGEMKRLPEFSKVSAVIGVSSGRDGDGDIFSQLHEATRAVYAHSSLGTNRVIPYSSLRFDSPDPQSIFTAECKSRISTLVELVDISGLNGEIDRLRHLDGGGRDPGKTPLFHLYNSFFEIFITALRQILPNDRAYYIQDQYNRAMQDSDTPEELTEALRSWTSAQLSGFEQHRDSGLVVRNAKRYIQNNFREKLTREAVARAVGLNPNYFSTLFSREAGMKFSDYLRDVRITEAKRLLADTTGSVASIANAVGYSEYRHFCKTFSRSVGASPSEYRKKCRSIE